MNITPKRKKLLAGAAIVTALAMVWVGILMLRPPTSKAFTLIEMPVYSFAPIEVSSNETAEVCSINWGDGTVNILIGLLMPSDTTKSASPIHSLEVKPHSSLCMALPAVQTPATNAGAPNFILPFVAVRNVNGNGNGDGGGERLRTFRVSLQLLDGGATKFVHPGELLPAVQVPTS